MARNGQDYTPAEIRRARQRHKGEITLERRIIRYLLRKSEPPEVTALRTGLRRVAYAAYADCNDGKIETLHAAVHAALTRWPELDYQSIRDQISSQLG